MKTVANLACKINHTAPGDCWNQSWKLTLLFSASEVVLSQVRQQGGAGRREGQAGSRRGASRGSVLRELAFQAWRNPQAPSGQCRAASEPGACLSCSPCPPRTCPAGAQPGVCLVGELHRCGHLPLLLHGGPRAGPRLL